MNWKRKTAAIVFAILVVACLAPSASAGDRSRFGFGANSRATDYDWATLGASWFHIWGPYMNYTLLGMEFYAMVAAYGDLMGTEDLAYLQQRYNWRPQNYPPGTVWIISNELEYDMFCTKNGTPITCRAITADEYAQKFKKYYDMVRQLQPYGSTYKFAIGFINAIVEQTRPYTLADVLNAYQARYGVPMPVDVFNLHVYGFGRSIDFDYCFTPTVTQYRQVMANKGYRDKPLMITELGVLEGVYVQDIPESYVLDFMVQAFDWLREATSDTTGMPSDGNRLVQQWAWFALTSWAPGLNQEHKWHRTALFDIDTKQITNVGLQYKDYVENLTHTEDTPLVPGWNLLSVPVELDSYDITDVLSSIAGSYDLAYAYDAVSDEWRVYNPGGPPGGNTLETLSPNEGLWVHATRSDTWTVMGQVRATVQVSLYTGWNLIAYPLTAEKPITEALSSIASKYTAVYAYDPTDPDLWLKYLPGAPSYVSNLAAMTPGYGYWIKVTQNCTATFTE